LCLTHFIYHFWLCLTQRDGPLKDCKVQFSCMLPRNKAVWWCIIHSEFFVMSEENLTMLQTSGLQILNVCGGLVAKSEFFPSPLKIKPNLISNFRPVLNILCFLLGNSSASEFYMLTFRNTLFPFYRWVGMKNDWVWEMLGYLYGKRFGSKIVWVVVSGYFRARLSPV
jgi:hypothetical protein